MKIIIKTGLALVLLMASISVMAQQSTPQAAKAYIQKHFPKDKISRVERDDSNYEIHLSSGYELEFSRAGKIKEVQGNGKSVPTSVIPAKISSYLKQKYPGQNVRKIEMESNGYEVNLGDDLEIKFDKAGNFKKVDN